MDQKNVEIKLDTALNLSMEKQQDLAMLLEATRSIPLSKNFTESARKIYDICKSYIGATCGYVAMMSDNGDKNDLLFLDDGGLNCTVDPELPMPIRGLRAEAYQSRKTAFSNDFMDSQWKKYLPGGHVTLDNVLFSPLNFGDRTVGVIGLANKKGGFTGHDVDIAGSFGEIAALALQHSKNLEILRDNEKFSSELLANAPYPTLVINPDSSIRYLNKAFEKLTGFSKKEIIARKLPYPWWPKLVSDKIDEIVNLAVKGHIRELKSTFHKKTGEEFIVEVTSKPVMANGKLDYYISTWVDITQHDRYEKNLIAKKEELASYADQLEKMNTALAVLLEHRDEEKVKILDDLFVGFKKLVFPYLEMTETCGRDTDMSTNAAIIKRNIQEIFSSLNGRSNVLFHNFTPLEIRVANLIRENKTTPEITRLLDISARSVYFHRENIRKKLKLANKKTNLRNYLQSVG